MEFNDIPVQVNGGIKYFNFNVTENGKGQVCLISSDGFELHIDEDFAVLQTNMPDDWQLAAMAKLKQILNYSE